MVSVVEKGDVVVGSLKWQTRGVLLWSRTEGLHGLFFFNSWC